jgi:SAM-dependent methyltransferase
MTLYILISFLSAFLLFQIQPLISKFILPWFGGTPTVWSTSMLFFQVLLVGGYAYAHLFALRLTFKKQVRVHMLILSLVVIATALLGWSYGGPLLPDARFRPMDSALPAARILFILMVSVGLPYFILTTTSPLVQTWFRHTYPGRSPYRLYALSNLGSLMGLISYPFLIEPALPLKTQTVTWMGGFLAYCALLVLTAAKSRSGMPSNEQAGLSSTRPGRTRPFSWLALAGLASVVLLATTNQMTQEVAVIPFLWVLPLTMYLLSFIIAFEGSRWYSRRGYLTCLFLITAAVIWMTTLGSASSIILQIFILTALVFFVSTVCHAEVYRLRPDPQHLTRFYLLIAVGGALGGLIVNLAAPHLFKSYLEFPLGILGVWLALFCLYLKEKNLVFRGPGWIKTPIYFGWLVFLGIFSFMLAVAYSKSALETTRNFYGVLRVTEKNSTDEEEGYYSLSHGKTIHGYQYSSAEKRMTPTSYYGTSTGAGIAIQGYRDHLEQQGLDPILRVGVVGLGIGTLAAYSEPGDVFRFYEINPEVIRLAEGDKGYFSYLKNMKGHYDIIEGDARLALEHESPKNYDILYIDAFSSDSIPVHLITIEAVGVYLKHLKPDGLLAIHISNRYLDLAPVVRGHAQRLHMEWVYIDTEGNNNDHKASWMILSSNSHLMNNSSVFSAASPPSNKPVEFWGDDYSNLFKIVK